jgi:hypothetical protein
VLTQRQLPDRATILVETDGAPDAFGNPSMTWTPGDPVPALLQQQSSVELVDQRDTVTTRALAIFLPGVAITADSRVQFASVPNATWRVVGTPAALARIGGRPSHTEAVVELIS